MDALALLCALHADGPQALKRLRQSGLSSLQSVAGTDVERLAALLACAPAAAQRFQREARHLIGRLGSGLGHGLLEAEHDAVSQRSSSEERSPVAQPENAAAARDAACESVSPVAVAVAVAAPASAALGSLEPPPALPRRAFDPALARWRELDALEARAAAETIVEESSAPVRHASVRTPFAVLPDLEPGARAALEHAGVIDLEGLIERDPLDVAEASGLDYTNAVRLAALARRALRSGGERFSRSERPPADRPSLLPEREALDYLLQPMARSGAPEHAESVGGPFA